MPIKNNSWLSLFLGFLAIPGAVSAQENEAPYDKVQEVFSGNKTVVGEQVDFPKKTTASAQ